jgi:hypothetical protein
MKRLLTPNYHPVNKKGLIFWSGYRLTGSVVTGETMRDFSGRAAGCVLYNCYINKNGCYFAKNWFWRIQPDMGQVYNTRTVMFWATLDELTESNYILFRDGSGFQGITLQAPSNGIAYLNSAGSNVVSGSWTSNTNPVHIALTVDSGNSTKLYINGTLADSSATTTAQDQIIYFGGKPSNTFPHSGSIDDIMVFNRELFAGEIKANYLKNKRG